jgi:hypothetical protein
LVSLAPDVIITNGGRAMRFSKRGFCELGYAMVAKVPRRPQGRPSAQTEVPRRRRGRPVDEATLATDQTVIDWAVAFVHLGLGSQRARDLARALVEGRSVPGRKLPRGRRKAAPGSRLVAYEMPLPLKSLEQRVARRLKEGVDNFQMSIHRAADHPPNGAPPEDHLEQSLQFMKFLVSP